MEAKISLTRMGFLILAFAGDHWWICGRCHIEWESQCRTNTLLAGRNTETGASLNDPYHGWFQRLQIFWLSKVANDNSVYLTNMKKNSFLVWEQRTLGSESICHSKGWECCRRTWPWHIFSVMCSRNSPTLWFFLLFVHF